MDQEFPCLYDNEGNVIYYIQNRHKVLEMWPFYVCGGLAGMFFFGMWITYCLCGCKGCKRRCHAGWEALKGDRTLSGDWDYF